MQRRCSEQSDSLYESFIYHISVLSTINTKRSFISMTSYIAGSRSEYSKHPQVSSCYLSTYQKKDHKHGANAQVELAKQMHPHTKTPFGVADQSNSLSLRFVCYAQSILHNTSNLRHFLGHSRCRSSGGKDAGSSSQQSPGGSTDPSSLDTFFTGI